MVTQGVRGVLVPMRGEVVEDDDGAWCDLWDQHFADVGSKGRAVHRTLYDPRRDQCILCQARDQGLGSPTAKRRIHRQALAPFCSATQAGQVGLHCSFINKDNATRQGGNGRQPMFEPISPLMPYLGAATFGGNQRLFLYVKPSRDSRLAMEEWCTCTPSASASASRSSKRVMSGSCATSSSRKT